MKYQVMQPLSTFILLLQNLVLINSFSLMSTTSTTKSNQLQRPISQYTSNNYNHKHSKISFLQMSSKNDQEEIKKDQGEDEEEAATGMSFQDATDALREQEEQERAANRGAMFEEVRDPFVSIVLNRRGYFSFE